MLYGCLLHAWLIGETGGFIRGDVDGPASGAMELTGTAIECYGINWEVVLYGINWAMRRTQTNPM